MQWKAATRKAATRETVPRRNWWVFGALYCGARTCMSLAQVNNQGEGVVTLANQYLSVYVCVCPVLPYSTL